MPASDHLRSFAVPDGEAWQRGIAAGFCPLVALAQHARKREGEKRHNKPVGASTRAYGASLGGESILFGVFGLVLLVFLIWLFLWHLWISPIINAVECKKYVWAFIVFFTQWFGGLIYRLSHQMCSPEQVGAAASQATDTMSQSMAAMPS